MFRSFDPDDAMSNVSETGTSNGLNQLTAYAGKALSHDANGNVTGFGSDSFAYNSENRMSSATVGGAGTTFSNDPMHRLFQVIAGGAIGRFSFDGLNAVSEHDGNNANALLRRWVYDPTTGQPVAQYEGTGVAAADRRYFSADERGSVISVSDSGGAALGINAYDEYGNPGGTVTGRYGYAGQPWIASARLSYMNARMYSPAIGGRFLQSDPIGMAGGVNLYAYAGNDPVNAVDRLGLVACPGEVMIQIPGPPTNTDEWGATVVTGSFMCVPIMELTLPRDRRSGAAPDSGGSGEGDGDPAEPVNQCTPTRSRLGRIAESAGNLSDAAAGLAVGSGVLAVATSETIVGGVTFGTIAAGLGVLSTGAAAVQGLATYFDKRPEAATALGLGAVVGGMTSISVGAAFTGFSGRHPAVRLGTVVLGQISGRTTTAMACSYAN